MDKPTTSIDPSDHIFSKLVEWIYISDSNSAPPLKDSGQQSTATQQPPISFVVHKSIGLDVDGVKYGEGIRVLRNKGSDIPRGTTVMCIPTISTTSLCYESSVPLKYDCSDVDYHSQEDYHSKEVHSLAWYLSQKPSTIFPYLASLPTSNSDLPRIWPEHTLQLLLSGSPVLMYIQSARQSVQLLYKQSQEQNDAALRLSNDKHLPSPTWSDYSYFHAMVTSRSFSYDMPVTNNNKNHETILSTDCAVASLHMVPILDLCDHRRGVIGSMNDESRKNISYTFRNCRDQTVGSTDVSSGVVVVDVVATHDILHNESLRITYGAKSNSVLLVNYGFTIANNIEPDGSSNDILEFYPATRPPILHTTKRKITDKSYITILRTGPPSYTYGCFTTALQSFLVTATNHDSIHETIGEDTDDDMEQFLNDCDDEEHEDNNDDNDDEIFDGKDVNTDSPRCDVSHEIKSIQEFRKHLLHLVDTYTLPKIKAMDWENFIPSEANSDSQTSTMEQIQQAYAANLIHGEIRILQFYLWVTERLEFHLLGMRAAETAADVIPSTLSKSLLKMSHEDVELLNGQVSELVAVYIKLRH